MSDCARSTAKSRAAECSLAWRQRREDLLQEVCRHVADHVAGGTRITRAFKLVSRKFRNRSLGGGRQLSLSSKSVERIYYNYRRSGRGAFALHYVAPRLRDIDPLLLRLIVAASVYQSKSVSQIVTETSVGDRAGRVSLATIYRALPAKAINQFLRAEKRLLSQRRIAEHKLIAIGNELRNLRAKAEKTFLGRRRA